MDHPSLDHLSAADRRLFFKFGFGPSTSLPEFYCVHHAFLHHAQQYPHSVAVEHGTDTITYDALRVASNHLAHVLRSKGVRPGSRVCILGSRGVSLITAILAVVMAGGQYVPLDGSIVKDSTIDFIAHDAEVTIALTLRAFTHRVPRDVPHLVIEDELNAIDRPENVRYDVPIEDISQTHDGLYVIYTSGTTGQPKGVSISHCNVTNLVQHSPGNLGITHGSRVGQILNIAFDMAAWEMWGALTNGATLVVRDEWQSVMRKIDTVIATPTILQAYPPAVYSNIRVAATAGEPCPTDLADAWAAHGTFYNSCGPTEITIVNTMVSHINGTTLSIGKPTPNNSIYILDEDMVPVPIGAPGVLWAGGRGITEGYIKLPQLNASRLRPDPYRGEGNMFNTGDLGKWNEDGTIEHLGRADDQVKIKGFRVELDGVKSAMETAPGIIAASALKIGTQLVGFYTPAIPALEVKAAAEKVLPYYAIPTRFYALDYFPLTSNGKTDKRALREIAETGSQPEASLKPVEITSEEPHQLSPKSSTITANSTDASSDHKTTGSVDTLDEKPVGEKLQASVSYSSVEKGYAWEGYLEDDVPDKTQDRWARNLRHQVFTLYRRLFGVVFVVNVAILVASLAQGGLTSPGIGKIVTANLLCAILMRQDHVVNAFFKVFCSVPASWPLSIRRVCARVYHIGGLHSGCSVSATVWFVYFAAQITIDFTRHKTSIPTLVFTYLIILLLLLIIFFAYPQNRLVKHDTFERTHRFLGWLATALVWVHTILLTNDFKPPAKSLGNAVLHSASFWMVVVLTLSIILPWAKLRKVDVRSEVLSNHAIRLYFDYVTPVAGSYTRISRSPLFEWHSFATIPLPGEKGYSLVVSRAGDWTGQTIEEPPTKLWVRGVPTCGVLRIVPLFNRVVFVATGSGIGPCAPCIFNQKVPIRLLWTSPDVRKTFGDKFVDSILACSPDAVIYDTRKHGKPDMVKLTYRLVKEFNAEAVCIISNQKLTRKVVYGMVSRGIPAFGAIWDS